MSYRFLNPAPVFFNIPGTLPLSGGKLFFYELGSLVVQKSTWSDPELTIENSNPVDLDSSGRASTNIWLDGDYTVVIEDAQGATIWTRDIKPENGSGTSIPALEIGKYLTNDGSNLLWEDVLQVPDPTGSNGYILSTDGVAIFWIPAAAAVPEIAVTNGSFWIGNTLVQFGNDTFPIPVVIPHHGAVKAVVFPIPFDACQGVICGANKNSIAVNGFKSIISAEYIATGFTAEYNTNENTADPNGEVNVTVPFSWIAWGTKAA